MSAMTDLGDSKEDAESLVNDVKKVAEKTTVSGLLLYTAISRKVVGKSECGKLSQKVLWVVLNSLFFKEV